MKNLLPVLRKLGKKMTGDDIAGTNLVTVVDDIAEKYTGSSGGSGGDGCDCTLVVTAQTSSNAITLDKTWQEIYDALAAGKRVVINDVDNTMVEQTGVDTAYFDDGENIYYVVGYVNTAASTASYKCATPSDYPSVRHNVA